jgi:hypothetical protein
MKEPVHSKAAVRTRLAGFLVPLHLFAEIGGVSVSIQSSPIRGDRAQDGIKLKKPKNPGRFLSKVLNRIWAAIL